MRVTNTIEGTQTRRKITFLQVLIHHSYKHRSLRPSTTIAKTVHSHLPKSGIEEPHTCTWFKQYNNKFASINRKRRSQSRLSIALTSSLMPTSIEHAQQLRRSSTAFVNIQSPIQTIKPNPFSNSISVSKHLMFLRYIVIYVLQERKSRVKIEEQSRTSCRNHNGHHDQKHSFHREE